jgi:hypothetical protein
MIKEKNGRYAVYNKEGSKKLSDWYTTKKEAVDRLKEIEYFKNKDNNVLPIKKKSHWDKVKRRVKKK